MHNNFLKFHTRKEPSIDGENRAHEYMHPLRDWTLALGTCTTIFVCGVLYIAYDFYVQFGIPNNDVSIDGKIIKYRDADVTTLAEEYTKRDTEFTTFRADHPVVLEEPIPEVATTTPEEPLAETPVAEYTSDVQ